MIGLVPVFVSATWSAGVGMPNVTSVLLILCILRMCETHCRCVSDNTGVIPKLTLYCYFVSSIAF